jgi:hypothetical protein
MSAKRGRPHEIPISRAQERVDARTERGGAAESDARSVPDLIRELSREGADLVRHEVSLAKAELSEKVDSYRDSAVKMAIGGAVLLAALLLFVQAVNHGLTTLLAQVMDLDVAFWLAPLILGLVLAAVGWGVFSDGKARMAEEGLVPEATKETLLEDSRWASRKVREVKEEIGNG